MRTYGGLALLVLLVSGEAAATREQRQPRCGQDVDCLIKRCVEASGGREALTQLASITRVGVIEFFGPAPNPSGKFSYRTDIVYPRKLREELAGEYVLVDRGTDGENFWQWSGRGYESVSDAGQRRSMLETAERANRDILWLGEELSDLKIASSGPDWAKDSDCLEGTHDKSRVFLCFDRGTGLISAKGNEVEHRLFTSWMKIKKILIPFHLRHFRGSDKVYEIILDRVEADIAIPASRFQMPLR